MGSLGPRLPNERIGATADPFYANDTVPWTYEFGGEECRGLWPLEAMCLALLLDKGVRCDVALVVFFARCLKTAGHIVKIDVHTRREVALYEALDMLRFKAFETVEEALPPKGDEGAGATAVQSAVEKIAALPMMRRYSALIQYFAVGDRLTSVEQWRFGRSPWDAWSISWTPVVIAELPLKESILSINQRDRSPAPLDHHRETMVGDLLVAAASCDSLDVAVILFTHVRREVNVDNNFHHFSPNQWIAALLRHGMKRFRLVTCIMLQSGPLRSFILGKAVSWDTLWECSSPEDAVTVAETLEVSVPDVFNNSSIQNKLSLHQMTICYEVHDALGQLQKLDATRLLPFLHLEAIEHVRVRGHYDKLFSEASGWLMAFLFPVNSTQPERYVSLDLFRYFKNVGASFQGASAIFGMNLCAASDSLLDDLYECLRFCIENDPLFPNGFSPSTVLSHLLQNGSNFRSQPEGTPSIHLTVVKYIHELALKHNLLGPDPATGDSLLTVLVLHHGGSFPQVHLCPDSGEPIIEIDIEECSVNDLKIVAATDPQKLLALFVAIQSGAVDAFDFLYKEYDFDLHSIRHPVSGESLVDFALNHPNLMLDYLSTLGIFDGARPHLKSPLRLACEEPSIVRMVHFLKNTNLNPFELAGGRSLLSVLCEAGENFKTIYAFVWCMCSRYGKDPRWETMVAEFLMHLVNGGIWSFVPMASDNLDRESSVLLHYARLFFLLQRAGVVQPRLESADTLQRRLAAAEAKNYELFARAASTDYTVESFTLAGEIIQVRFDTAYHLVCSSSPSVSAEVPTA